MREGLEAATVKTFPSFLLFSGHLSQPGLPWMNKQLGPYYIPGTHSLLGQLAPLLLGLLPGKALPSVASTAEFTAFRLFWHIEITCGP